MGAIVRRIYAFERNKLGYGQHMRRAVQNHYTGQCNTRVRLNLLYLN